MAWKKVVTESAAGEISQDAAGLTATLAIASGGTGAVDAAAARAALSGARSGANSDITSITGLTTDLAVAHGGTGSSTASAARTALGLAIGSDVQAFGTNLNTWGVVAPSTNGKSLVSAANYAAMRTALSVPPIASPALTGTPTAPTAATATDTEQIATTAYVQAQGYATASGDITGVTIVTDSGSGSKMSDNDGSADFEFLGATGVGVTNSGTTATITAVPGEIAITGLSGYSSATYANASSVGAASIVTVGTIGTGAWNADVIPVGKGGTGATATTGSGNNVLSVSPGFTGTASFPAGGVEIDGNPAITEESTIEVAKGGTGATAKTGTGNNVLSASPTFTGTIGAASLTVSGNLTVSGTTITTSTETLNIADNTIVLNSDLGASAAVDTGFVFERGATAANKTFYYDTSANKMVLGDNAAVAIGGTYQADMMMVRIDGAAINESSSEVPIGHMQYHANELWLRVED